MPAVEWADLGIHIIVTDEKNPPREPQRRRFWFHDDGCLALSPLAGLQISVSWEQLVQKSPLNREKITGLARLGIINGYQADTWARSHLNRPLSGPNADKAADVMQPVAWSPAMTVAWIAFKDPHEVLKQYDDWRADNLVWTPSTWVEADSGGRAKNPRLFRHSFALPPRPGRRTPFNPPPRVHRTSVDDFSSAFSKYCSSGWCLEPQKNAALCRIVDEYLPGRERVTAAISQFTEALAEGHIEAWATRLGETRLDPVRRDDWLSLRSAIDANEDEQFLFPNSGDGYTGLKVKRAAVLAKWPMAADPSNGTLETTIANPPTTKTKMPKSTPALGRALELLRRLYPAGLPQSFSVGAAFYEMKQDHEKFGKSTLERAVKLLKSEAPETR